jgi:hypothetical protein
LDRAKENGDCEFTKPHDDCAEARKEQETEIQGNGYELNLSFSAIAA